MTLDEALYYIHSVCWKGSVPGLERISALLDKMGHPERKLKFIHVTGTNGKGSTCAMLASMFTKAGYKTGLYTSPFLIRFNERIQINGQQIPDEALVELVEQVKPAADAMEDVPTEFEIITALGMLYFAQQQCDIVGLEVGLGGTLDSTNVIEKPACAVITALGMDHVKELGPTLADIAAAKAGATGHDVDAAARKVIEDAGYGPYFGHSFGHGVGVEIHEGPNATPSNDKPLPAGAVISAEPGIYLPGRFGVRIEDVLYLTGEGNVDITKAPKELIILG